MAQMLYSLSGDKIIDSSKLKSFADDKLNHKLLFLTMYLFCGEQDYPAYVYEQSDLYPPSPIDQSVVLRT